jgi:2-polyprenyl-3-methyl-5-hydroxy-6-metoxy-1,4-benzoquinol methylase
MHNTDPSPGKAEPAEWEQIDCPVCGSSSFTLLFEKRGEPFAECRSCALVLINPRPVQARLMDTYTHDYSKHYARKAGKKLRRCRRWVRRVKKHVDCGRWLDVGCSAGFVALAAQEAGYEAWGVDVENWGIQYGQDVLRLQNLYPGTLEDQRFPSGFFNVISLYDVIEHVPDLNSLTAELKRLLAPGGVIDIITPDIGHWRTPKKLSAWDEIKPSEHLYYFNKETLERLLNNHGLTIVQKRFHFKPSLRVYVKHTD